MNRKGIEVGLVYFYVHFICEVACFYVLSNATLFSVPLWMVALMYDTFAFVPQSLFGLYSDKHPKINIGIVGLLLIVTSFILLKLNIANYFPVIIICIGNCLIHVDGAEITLRISNGKMAPSAIFVSGGSIGAVCGKLLAKSGYSYLLIIGLIISAIPFSYYGNMFRFKDSKEIQCSNFNYANKNIKPFIVIILTLSAVIIRGYMGYGIPTTWKKTVFENVLFYMSLTFGKAIGGILVDKIGIRKTSFLSVIGSVPFLIFGDNILILSIIGVCFFSMTMAITLAIIISCVPSSPGLGFGITTIGLFLGSLPTFFVKITSIYINSVLIIFLSIICIMILKIVGKENSYENIR